jgi:hypothetical protein
MLPSITSSAAVMQLDRDGGEEEHSIRDVPAISFGSISALLSADADIFVQIGVSMTPGWTVLTRMLSPAAMT